MLDLAKSKEKLRHPASLYRDNRLYLALVIGLCFPAIMEASFGISKDIDSPVPENIRAHMSVMVSCTVPNVIFGEHQQFRHLLRSKIARKRKMFDAKAL
jgi:hypothetical protein